MDGITSQFTQVRESWETAKAALQANPTWWTPYSSGLSLEQIDETISSLGEFIPRIKIPTGFKPAFHLAKASAALSLQKAVTALTNVRNVTHGRLPEFFLAVTDSTMAFHSMLAFGGKEDGRRLTADLAVELAQSLSLLDTAQKELAAKQAQLEKTEELAKQIESNAETAASSEAEIVELLETTKKQAEDFATTAAAKVAEAIRKTDEQLESAEKVLDEREEELQKHSEEWSEKSKLLQQSIEECSALKSKLDEQEKVTAKIQELCEEQQTLITALLPKGASAGLAAGFEARANQMETTKYIWFGAFIFSIVGLIGIACWLATETTGNGQTDLWLGLIQRLPFAAPLIWLGWFSAVQYGNTIRVQEDYAFKAATSKAFAGYKDHMEHMASVELKDANSAMLLLAQRTIEILAHEPLRIYGKPSKDVSPSAQVSELIKGSERNSG